MLHSLNQYQLYHNHTINHKTISIQPQLLQQQIKIHQYLLHYQKIIHYSPKMSKASKKSHTDLSICEPTDAEAQVKVGNCIHNSLICQQQQISTKKMGEMRHFSWAFPSFFFVLCSFHFLYARARIVRP